MPTLETASRKSKALPLRPVSELMALPPSAIVTLPECAALARISLRHVAAMRAIGKGPKTMNVGRSVRMTLAAALEWIGSTHSSESGKARTV